MKLKLFGRNLTTRSTNKDELILNNYIAGFTLLEVIAAIFVIVFGLVGVLSLIVQNVQVQYINKNNLIASQLAQECLELVRNGRDYNWLLGNNWDNGLNAGNYIVDYTIDYTTDSLVPVISINDAKLRLDATGFYWHGVGSDTIFSRLITITQSSPELLNIFCLVQWPEKSNIEQYVAETVLYDWR